MMKSARNGSAWAIGEQRRNGFYVRRVVWGLLMAQSERREGEEVRAAFIQVEAKYKRRRDVMQLPLRPPPPVAAPTIDRLAEVKW
jgi:hypothetical protein